MNITELQSIIYNGEDETIEFKQSFSKAVIETLVAFANTKGGKVIIGVKDDKSVVGISVNDETIQKWINEIKQNTEPAIIPDVELFNLEEKEIAVFKINEFPVKPLSFKGRYYVRKQNSNHQLSVQEISDIYLYSIQYSWDSYLCKSASKKDIDISLVDKFVDKVNSTERFLLSKNNLDALSKLKLIRDDLPTKASIILFSKDFFRYNVHIGRFKSSSNIIADDIITGDLYTVLEESMKKIISHIKFAFEITGQSTQRTEIPEYPLEAIRELLVNSLVHRDYTDTSDVQIKIFDNKISFFNPGTLYGGLTIEDLATDDYHARTRNKLIAETLYLTKDIEKYGSGYTRIRKYITDYPTMIFDYKEISGGFLTTLSYSYQRTTLLSEPVNDPVSEPVSEPVNNRQNELVNLLKNNNSITVEELRHNLKVGRETIKRDLKKLKDLNLIKRVGSDKTGYWKIIEKE